MEYYCDLTSNIDKDNRFQDALKQFNSGNWYLAHDLFEEIWHETNGLERKTIQAFLQIAVAQLHIQKGNKNGATLLYGEGLGRLRTPGIPDFGIDLDQLIDCISKRLRLLQENRDPEEVSVPFLCRKM